MNEEYRKIMEKWGFDPAEWCVLKAESDRIFIQKEEDAGKNLASTTLHVLPREAKEGV